MLALAACGGGGTTAGPTSTAPPEPAPTAAAPADPAAPATGAKQPTAPGPNLTPDGVVFNFKPDGGGKGKKVFLAGTFNDWKPDNPQYLMADDDGDGTWSITVKLPPGSYQYKFVADGQWIKDPYSPGDAPDGFGGRNGKVDVK
ncbi:MAG TPA: glycogen-binding domain-containing protein [Kofleriaceae bacterium]|nr:glycogen-binding domain-containing protein [Kofleriaceae bacterium]